MSFKTALATLALGTCVSAAAFAIECGPDSQDGVLQAEGDGAYVKFRIDPAPPAMGDLFVVDAKVCSSAHAPMDGELSADAVMPAHGHGMNYAVETARTVDGAAKLEGFLWQMPGVWQLRFRLKTPDGNYRSTYDYEFAPR